MWKLFVFNTSCGSGSLSVSLAEMPFVFLYELQTRAQRVAQWLRREDWIERHHAFAYLMSKPLHAALVHELLKEMSSDELLWGMAAGSRWPEGRPIELPDRQAKKLTQLSIFHFFRRAKKVDKVKELRQLKITDFFRKAPKLKKRRQKRLSDYFQRKHR